MNFPGRGLMLGGFAALGLSACSPGKQIEEFSQEGFLAATQENINGVPTTIEVFEAGTNNPGVVGNPDCIRSDIARGVSDLLEEGDDRETVDVCLFPNEGSIPDEIPSFSDKCILDSRTGEMSCEKTDLNT